MARECGQSEQWQRGLAPSRDGDRLVAHLALQAHQRRRAPRR